MSLIKWISQHASRSERIRKAILGDEIVGVSKVEDSPETDPEDESSEDPKPEIEIPDTGPAPRTGHFLRRWSGVLFARLLKKKAKTPSQTENRSFFSPTHDDALSIRMARQINRLEIPLLCLCALLILLQAIDLGAQILLLIYPGFSEFSLMSLWLQFSQSTTTLQNQFLAPVAVGYGTNWIAIKMLFHPRHPNPVWQGLIPARREDLIESIADGILERLISPEIVRSYLHESGILQRFFEHTGETVRETFKKPEFRRQFKAMVMEVLKTIAQSEDTKERVGNMVEEKIRSFTGSLDLAEFMAAMTRDFWGPRLKEQVLTMLPHVPKALEGALDQLDGLLDGLPEKIASESDRLEAMATRAVVEALHSLDIRHIVKAQLDKMDEQELENMLTGDVMEELRFIQVMGGVFGGLVALALAFPPFRLVLAGALAIMLYTIQKYRRP